MRLVCIGLLLYSVTWAAPTFQPQTVKTSQGSVEELKQKKKNNNNIAFDLLEERRNQEVTPKERITQKKRSDLPFFAVNENNKSSKYSNLLVKTQTIIDNTGISHKGKAHDDLMMTWVPESTVDKRTDGGDDAISHLPVQEEYGATLKTNSMRPVNVMELWGEGSKEKTHSNVLSKILAGVNYVKAHSEGKKNHQRDSQDHKSSLLSKSNHHIRRDTHYLTRVPKGQKVPSDFEGSGDIDPQETGDNDLSPFSGDGQLFKDVCGEGEVIGPDIETELPDQSGSETINLDPRLPGYNEIPETEGHGGTVIGASSDRVKETGTGVSLVECNNDIIGNTNFRELPGKEGNRVNTDSQNAQGKVERHYPNAPSREKGKDGDRDANESAHYNEIPKHGKGSSNKGPEQSNRNEVIVSEKPRLSSQGKSQGLRTPSHGLDNEMRNEIGSHNVPSNEGNLLKHGRQSHDGQHNSTGNKGRYQRRGPWSYRRPHSHRSFSPSKRDHSSESSDSDSSGESEGD
ncbi:matrix extracellular phosphoglycoprotein [Dipodomys merriami]|uniref:matrix extracellular phosphoglycoprotein n=1 Tax=Dipodomys merriami TaxID=94247 RepID=UPI003855B4F7